MQSTTTAGEQEEAQREGGGVCEGDEWMFKLSRKTSRKLIQSGKRTWFHMCILKQGRLLQLEELHCACDNNPETS